MSLVPSLNAKSGTTQQNLMSETELAEFNAGIENFTTQQLEMRTRMFQGNANVIKSNIHHVGLQIRDFESRISENEKKISQHKQLPYLVSTIAEVLDMPEQSEEGDNVMDESPKLARSVVIKTSQRQTIFLPIPGLIDSAELKPGDLVGVNKDTHIIMDSLPPEYDHRIKSMEVEDKPTDDYNDIGGLDTQIEELKEAIVYPLTHPHLYQSIGIRPPKGALLYGPPGTGKTLIARACAARTNACFIKISAPQLVQMYIGDGARMVRDAFALGKQKAELREKISNAEGVTIQGATIIFIDEIDAIGTKRFDNDKSGDREVQRTMLELLNQLDGFSSNDRVKVIAATNRPDILDPALLRSGRLDRKIEIALPDQTSRLQILRIHSSKMRMDKNVDLAQIAAQCNDFNGAQLKAVCVESGMIALRQNKTKITQAHLEDAIQEVISKKKVTTHYYA